jgi:glycosyltransferase involved in cell wall biosynthesis
MRETNLKKKTISVFVCAYNEEPTVYRVLKKLGELGFADEIVVLDNGSTDRTRSEIQRAAAENGKIRMLTKDRNIGLGDGVRTLIAATTGDIVARQDADLEYDPEELPLLIEQLENGNADVVYGSRVLVRKTHKVHYYYNYVANILLTHFSNIVTNLFLSDVETASKAFDGHIVRAIPFVSDGFEIENEMTIKLKAAGCTFYEVPISYYGRTYEQGKKIRPIDGLKAVWAILKFSMLAHFDEGLRRVKNTIPHVGAR